MHMWEIKLKINKFFKNTSLSQFPNSIQFNSFRSFTILSAVLFHRVLVWVVLCCLSLSRALLKSKAQIVNRWPTRLLIRCCLLRCHCFRLFLKFLENIEFFYPITWNGQRFQIIRWFLHWRSIFFIICGATFVNSRIVGKPEKFQRCGNSRLVMSKCCSRKIRLCVCAFCAICIFQCRTLTFASEFFFREKVLKSILKVTKKPRK